MWQIRVRPKERLSDFHRNCLIFYRNRPKLCFRYLQGISLWNVSFKLTLRDRNIQVIFCLKVVLESWDWIFFGITTSFHKSNIDWPHQPPTEMLPILVKICIFDGPFHKKGLLLVIWVPGMINPSGSVDFLMKWGCWGHWGCWGYWGHWDCRGVEA